VSSIVSITSGRADAAGGCPPCQAPERQLGRARFLRAVSDGTLYTVLINTLSAPGTAVGGSWTNSKD